jgi:glycosyltransferase involved in cell wall biosynthesis
LKTAYVLLWFPKPSETFIFHEAVELARQGLPLKIFTLYGALQRNLSPAMTCHTLPVERLGIRMLGRLHRGIAHWLRKNPATVKELFRTVPVRRWCDIEAAGENIWAFLCGFHLARRFQEEGIEHIHAPWANGPATAAWVAGRLTGIPFSFAVHAGDIYPPDGALEEKVRDCVFVRSENHANVLHLRACVPGCETRIHTIYSGHPLRECPPRVPPMVPPFQMLSLGRFVPKKGFDVLIHACRIMKASGLDFRLALGGWGPGASRLQRLVKELDVSDHVRFHGFIRYDQVPEFLASGDLFVMPSVIDSSGDRDGIPNVIVEALLCGLPVVATDVCGISEVIRDEETGLLVPPGDARVLAHAISRVFRNPAWATDLARRGRALICEEFDLERNCRRILELFDELIPSP